MDDTPIEELPTVVSESVLDVPGFGKLRCYVLSNGKRIFNADDVHRIVNVLTETGEQEQPE